MWPSFDKVAIDTRHPYSLYAYGVEIRDAKYAILFLPGNSGSYKQVRTLGSYVNEHIEEVQVYTINFNEEFIAFSSKLIRRQAEFTCEAARKIGKKIIIVAHSMGGYVARLAAKQCDIDYTFTLSVPEPSAMFALDHMTDEILLMKTKREFTVSSGWNDMMAPKSTSVSVAEFPFSWSDPDHLAVVWSHSIMRVLTNLIKAYIRTGIPVFPKAKVEVNGERVDGCQSVDRLILDSGVCSKRVFDGPILTSLRYGKDFVVDRPAKLSIMPGKTYPFTVIGYQSMLTETLTRIDTDGPVTVFVNKNAESPLFHPLYYLVNEMKFVTNKPEGLEKIMEMDAFMDRLVEQQTNIASWLYIFGTPVSVSVSTDASVVCQQGNEYPFNNNGQIQLYSVRPNEHISFLSHKPFTYRLRVRYFDTFVRLIMHSRALLFHMCCLIALIALLPPKMIPPAFVFLWIRYNNNSFAFTLILLLSSTIVYEAILLNRLLVKLPQAPLWTTLLSLLPFPLGLVSSVAHTLRRKHVFHLLTLLFPLVAGMIPLVNMKREYDFTGKLHIDYDWRLHLRAILMALPSRSYRVGHFFAFAYVLLHSNLWAVWDADIIIRSADLIMSITNDLQAK